VQILEILRRGGAQDVDVGNVVAVGDSDARKTSPQRIAGRNIEPVAVLRIVEKIVRAERVEQRNQILARQNRGLAALVIVEVAYINDEAQLQRLIEEVRLGESQVHILHTG